MDFPGTDSITLAYPLGTSLRHPLGTMIVVRGSANCSRVGLSRWSKCACVIRTASRPRIEAGPMGAGLCRSRPIVMLPILGPIRFERTGSTTKVISPILAATEACPSQQVVSPCGGSSSSSSRNGRGCPSGSSNTESNIAWGYLLIVDRIAAVVRLMRPRSPGLGCVFRRGMCS